MPQFEIKDAPSFDFYDKDDRNSQVYYGKCHANFGGYVEPEHVPNSDYATTHLFTDSDHAVSAVVNLAADLVMASLGAGYDIGEAGREDVHRYDQNEYPDVEQIPVDEENPLTERPLFAGDEVNSATLSLDARSRDSRWTDTGDAHDFIFTAVLSVFTERPSVTPTEEVLREAIEETGIVETIHPAMEKAMIRALAIQHERVAHHRRVTEATNVADSLADHFKTKGKERVNYSERLEGLREERDSAIQTVAHEFQEEESAEALAEEWDVSVEAVEAALDNWNDFLSTGSGFAAHGAPDRMDPSLVE